MRRLFILVLVIILIISFSVTAIAVSVDSECFYYDSSDGNTHLATIAASSMTPEFLSYYEDWKQSDRRMLCCNPDGTTFFFYNLNVTATVTLTYPFSGTDSLGINCSGADIDEDVGLLFSCTLSDDGYLYPDSSVWGDSDCPLCGRYTALDQYIILCSPSLQKEITFPSPVSAYVVDYIGSLSIEDDLDDSSNNGDDSEQSGILGFLSDFWEKLKSFFLGLFVPSEGYFKAWYNEVKAAFEEKLSPIFALYEQLTSFFNNVSAAEDTTLFNNPILVSCLSWVKGLITGLVLLLTLIAAYKKIISFIAI